MRVRPFVMAAVLALLLAPGAARAEQGLLVARLAGGISMVHPDMPRVGGAVSAALDYGISERLGAVFSLLSVLHGDARTLGIGAGFRGLLLERPSWRIFLHVGPELLLVWRPDQELRLHRGAPEGREQAQLPVGVVGVGEGAKPREGQFRVDLSFRGGLGCEYLLMWGLGVVLELYGSTPMGLGEVRILDAAAAGATLGLFMEF